MRATFSNTVDILVKAYLNETLEVGNYCACAVGNLIAHSCGIEIVAPYELRKNPSKLRWKSDKYVGDEWFKGRPQYLDHEGHFLVDSTGYSAENIFKIEAAFESQRFTNSPEFNGLMAVVNVLAEIHNVDLSVRESAKQLFVKA